MKYLKILTILMLATMTGCAANGPIFVKPQAAPAESSLVYIYREMGFVGSAVCYTIFVDGDEVGCLSVGGYLRTEVKPGERIFVAAYMHKGERMGPLSLPLDIEAGKIYYLEYVSTVYSVDDDGKGTTSKSYDIPIMPFASGLIPRMETEALDEIQELHESI
jgi:hypothetical protein